MTLLGEMEKDKIKQMHGPFGESWTSRTPQEAKLVTLLKRNALISGRVIVRVTVPHLRKEG